MDQNHKEASISEEMEEMEKCCTACNTKTTPLWRNGPFGPKSLCNACGIRYRKKSPDVGSRKKSKKKVKSSAGDGERSEEDLSVRVMALGKQVVLLEKKKKRRSRKKKDRRKFGEAEQAAYLLMALSCGSFFGKNGVENEA